MPRVAWDNHARLEASRVTAEVRWEGLFGQVPTVVVLNVPQ